MPGPSSSIRIRHSAAVYSSVPQAAGHRDPKRGVVSPRGSTSLTGFVRRCCCLHLARRWRLSRCGFGSSACGLARPCPAHHGLRTWPAHCLGGKPVFHVPSIGPSLRLPEGVGAVANLALDLDIGHRTILLNPATRQLATIADCRFPVPYSRQWTRPTRRKRSKAHAVPQPPMKSRSNPLQGRAGGGGEDGCEAAAAVTAPLRGGPQARDPWPTRALSGWRVLRRARCRPATLRRTDARSRRPDTPPGPGARRRWPRPRSPPAGRAASC